MRATVLLAVGGSLLNFSAGAFDQSAPFGFSWGPPDKIPTPSLATRHANITLLIYRRDRLPSDQLPGTEEIVLQVCKKEGLQEIIWISKFLSDSEEHAVLQSIIEEGTRRYGKAEFHREKWFSGIGVKPSSLQFRMIKACTAFSWRVVDRNSVPVLRSTVTQ